MSLLKKHWKKFALVLILFAGYFLFKNFQTKRAEAQIKYPTTASFDTKKDKVVLSNLGDIKQGISLTGKIQASRVASPSFQTGGMLTWVGVKLGDRVKKGQAIASIDRATLQKQFKKEMNDYLTNRSTFEDTQDKYKPTKERHLLTDEIRRILDRTQWSLENAVIDVELQALAMRYSTITSPIDGIVVELTEPNAGVFVGPTPIATIIDPESIYFRSEVDEEDVIKIYSNQQSTITLDSFPDNPLKTYISYIAFDSLENKAATVYELRFDLPLENSNLKYRLGMNGNVVIQTFTKNQTIIVPNEAIFFDDNQNFVYKQTPQGDKKIKVPVNLGLVDNFNTEITQGVAVGDKIVIPNDEI